MVEEDHQLQYAIMKSLEDQVMDEKIGPGRENRSEEMYIDQEQIQFMRKTHQKLSLGTIQILRWDCFLWNREEK